MSDEDRGRLQDAEYVLHGPGSASDTPSIVYPIYVGLLLALTYGFTVARGVFVTSDPVAVRGVLFSPATAIVGVVTAGLMLVAAYRAGRIRGPVVPPPPWIDQVVSSAIDRRLTLRAWWRMSAAFSAAAGLTLGGLLGGGLWAAAVTGPFALIMGLAGGLALGTGVVLAWLAGQVSTDGGPTVHDLTARFSLRQLRIGTLREQAVRTTHLGGALLGADLRSLRLEIATPIRRARGRRLRPGGPMITMARRDLLGQRRQPGALGAGLLLSAGGGALLGWGLTSPPLPPLLLGVGPALAYLGVGQWSEGLRLGADTSGCPSLYGLTPRREALAHSVVPGLLASTVITGAGIVSAALAGASIATLGAVAGWLLGCVVILLALQWVTAYRGAPPLSGFAPGSGPTTLILFSARSLLVATFGVGALTALAAHNGVTATLPTLLLAAAVCLSWASGRQRRLCGEHRV